MPTKTNIQKKALLEALEKSMGIVTSACNASGVTRDRHYHWMKNDPKYKAKVDELLEVALDFGESKLMQNISKGSDTAIIFFLKTKGKKRGYVEKTEQDWTTNGKDFFSFLKETSSNNPDPDTENE